MNVLGLDYDASNVHLVLVDEDTGAYVDRWKADLACGPGDAFKRSRRVRDLLPGTGLLEQWQVVGAAIELPYSRFAASLVPLMRVQGAIIASLSRSLELVELRPQTWKKLTVGQSNADKDAIARWAVEQGCPLRLDQDSYDAYCIGRAYLAMREGKEVAAA